MSIPIVEIFNSIEGEGKRVGSLCTFVRVAGCNLRCSYCDTTYSFDVTQAVEMSVQDIMETIDKFGCHRVTLTGGEPLLNEEVIESLIPALLRNAKEVNIETNGSILLTPILHKIIENDGDDKIFFTMDWKSLSSGMSHKMLDENIDTLCFDDVLKFVVADKDDLEQMKNVIESHEIHAEIFVSPVFGKIQMRDIVEFLQQNNLQNVRLQCQLHKIVWDPNERGV